MLCQVLHLPLITGLELPGNVDLLTWGVALAALMPMEIFLSMVRKILFIGFYITGSFLCLLFLKFKTVERFVCLQCNLKHRKKKKMTNLVQLLLKQ